MRAIIISFCVVTFFLGCEKKDDTNIVDERYIIAGLSNDSNIIKITPAFYSICEKESYFNRNAYGLECSTIDYLNLGLDELDDFKFVQSFLSFTPKNCDTANLNNCESVGEEQSYIKTLNGFQIAYKTGELISPLKFSKYDTINTYKHWAAENRLLYFSWLRNNLWRDYTTAGYIGIRLIEPDTIYGWIKIDVKEGFIKIDEYFLDK